MTRPTGGQIVFEQATDGDLWARLPETLLRDQRVNGNALRVYAILQVLGVEARHRGGPGYQGQAALGDAFAMSESTVRRALTALEAAGYIRAERVGLGEPDNIIILRLP